MTENNTKELFNYFSRELEKRFTPFLQRLAQDIKQQVPQLATRIYSGIGGDLTVDQSYSLLLEVYFDGFRDKDLGSPVLIFSLEQTNNNNPRIEAFVMGNFDRMIGTLFKPSFEVGTDFIEDDSKESLELYETGIEITVDYSENILVQLERGLPFLEKWLKKAVEEFLPFYDELKNG